MVVKIKTITIQILDFKFYNKKDIKDSTTVSSDNNEMNTGELDKGATITKDVIGEVPVNTDVNSLNWFMNLIFLMTLKFIFSCKNN